MDLEKRHFSPQENGGDGHLLTLQPPACLDQWRQGAGPLGPSTMPSHVTSPWMVTARPRVPLPGWEAQGAHGPPRPCVWEGRAQDGLGDLSL